MKPGVLAFSPVLTTAGAGLPLIMSMDKQTNPIETQQPSSEQPAAPTDAPKEEPMLCWTQLLRKEEDSDESPTK